MVIKRTIPKFKFLFSKNIENEYITKQQKIEILEYYIKNVDNLYDIPNFCFAIPFIYNKLYDKRLLVKSVRDTDLSYIYYCFEELYVFEPLFIKPNDFWFKTNSKGIDKRIWIATKTLSLLKKDLKWWERIILYLI